MTADLETGGNGRYVTVASYNELRRTVRTLTQEFHELRDGLVGSSFFPGGKLAQIEKQISDVKTLVENMPETMAQQRAARLWQGWRAKVVTGVAAIITSLLITVLSIWIANLLHSATTVLQR